MVVFVCWDRDLILTGHIYSKQKISITKNIDYKFSRSSNKLKFNLLSVLIWLVRSVVWRKGSCSLLEIITFLYILFNNDTKLRSEIHFYDMDSLLIKRPISNLAIKKIFTRSAYNCYICLLNFEKEPCVLFEDQCLNPMNSCMKILSTIIWID